MKKTIALLMASLFLLNGCADIVRGSRQDIRVKADPQTPGQCTATNGRGTYNSSIPNTIVVKRSKTDLTISCIDSATGVRSQKTVQSELTSWWWGNIALLSALGLTIDGVSGAMWQYPKNIVIPHDSMQAAPTSYYQYQQTPDATPYAPAANSYTVPAYPQAAPTPNTSYVPAYPAAAPAAGTSYVPAYPPATTAGQ